MTGRGVGGAQQENAGDGRGGQEEGESEAGAEQFPYSVRRVGDEVGQREGGGFRVKVQPVRHGRAEGGR